MLARLQALVRGHLVRRFGCYSNVQEFRELKAFDEPVIPTVMGEWKKLFQLSSTGATSLSPEEQFREFLFQRQDFMPSPHRLGVVRKLKPMHALQRLRWSGNQNGEREALTTFSLEKYNNLQMWRHVVMVVWSLIAALSARRSGSRRP